MAKTKMQIVNVAEAQTNQKRKEEATSAPIRVRHKTKTKLEQLLKQANKNQAGRKVKPDDLICFALGLIVDEHLAEICDSKLSNKDRMEQLFKKFCKERRGATRDEFLGLLLEGKVSI